MKATKPEEIAVPLGRLANQLGLTSWYVGSLVHETELHRGFGFYNGAPDWSAHYSAKRYSDVDPVFRHALAGEAPVQWSELARTLGGDDDRKDALLVLREAAEFGIRDGFTKSWQCLGDVPGIATFGGEDPDLSKQARMSLLLLGAFAYEGFRRVTQGFRPVAAALTQREADVLRWAAEGKTAWEIGQVLSIAERTVRCYMDQLKRKYNVPTMVQVVVRGMLDGNLKISPSTRQN